MSLPLRLTYSIPLPLWRQTPKPKGRSVGLQWMSRALRYEEQAGTDRPSIAGSDAEAVWVGSTTGAAIDCAGMTGAAGSDDAIEEGSVSIVSVIGATIEGPRTCKYGGIGCPVHSLKDAPRLLDTVISGTSSEEV